ncbi:hypothetical protein Stube_54260 [Streptomyces tubercidicus]|uniref:Uncharacterized protein n=1 Tax=Streptomyces tubercidicus TaxID=47759 RepID=A0A640UXF5_9ACTN|nr:hypothetical protein Stube_54260 [Streptomyces tubercidicus]
MLVETGQHIAQPTMHILVHLAVLAHGEVVGIGEAPQPGIHRALAGRRHAHPDRLRPGGALRVGCGVRPVLAAGISRGARPPLAAGISCGIRPVVAVRLGRGVRLTLATRLGVGGAALPD